jgi:hypothetical protein
MCLLHLHHTFRRLVTLLLFLRHTLRILTTLLLLLRHTLRILTTLLLLLRHRFPILATMLLWGRIRCGSTVFLPWLFLLLALRAMWGWVLGGCAICLPFAFVVQSYAACVAPLFVFAEDVLQCFLPTHPCFCPVAVTLFSVFAACSLVVIFNLGAIAFFLSCGIRCWCLQLLIT